MDNMILKIFAIVIIVIFAVNAVVFYYENKYPKDDDNDEL